MTIDERKRWCIIYTKSRGEKKLVEELNRCDVNSYLPLMKQEKKWSDRIKTIEVPVFPSYVFVEVNNKNYYSALECNNAVKYVFQGSIPAFICSKEIEHLKTIEKESNGRWTCTDRTFSKGELVCLTSGPLKGMSGKIVKINNKKRFTLRIEAMNKSILMDLSLNEILAMRE